MSLRIGLRCAPCGWATSRAPRRDADYGACPRCGRALRVLRPRRSATRASLVFPSAPMPPAPITSEPPPPPRYHDQYATWPELVAAELDRRERQGTATRVSASARRAR